MVTKTVIGGANTVLKFFVLEALSVTLGILLAIFAAGFLDPSHIYSGDIKAGLVTLHGCVVAYGLAIASQSIRERKGKYNILPNVVVLTLAGVPCVLGWATALGQAQFHMFLPLGSVWFSGIVLLSLAEVLAGNQIAINVAHRDFGGIGVVGSNEQG